MVPALVVEILLAPCQAFASHATSSSDRFSELGNCGARGGEFFIAVQKARPGDGELLPYQQVRLVPKPNN